MHGYIKPVYACTEHIDVAIDDFLVEHETFPVLSKAEEGKCSYCSKPAEYILTKEE